MMIKRIIGIFILASVVPLAVSCYDPYVKDYEYTSVHMAYQYDLRTFVVGEGMQFKLTAGLGGLLQNKEDREVGFEIDTSLVRGTLNRFWPGSSSDVTAVSEIKGQTTYGKVSQEYVKNDFIKGGAAELLPLPGNTFSLSDSRIIIRSGRMTGSVTVQADSLAFMSLPMDGRSPYYAIGFRIIGADADTVLLSKSYQVCAVRYENMFFGYWYHGGETTVTDTDGNVLEIRRYPTAIPSDESTHKVYTLSTAAPNAVTTNYIGDGEGSVKLIYNGGFVKVVSNDKRKVVDMESTFNRAPLLQDRKLFLNYRYTNTDGTICTVKDTLTFRNRIRDGVNEWQDTNTSHYYE